MLISSPVLAHYDHVLPAKLTVYSSSYALGAVLSHVYSDRSEKSVAFISRVLSESECKFPQIGKGLVIIYGIKKSYDYLYDKTYILETDHSR